MSLIISSYRLVKESVESEFKITLDVFKNSDIHFINIFVFDWYFSRWIIWQSSKNMNFNIFFY